MSSTSNRGQIVLRALGLAGRGVEIRDSANEWLDDLLQYWAQTYRFPSLRKIGDAITLSAGTSSVALPSDFGAGMAKLGLLFGTEKVPLSEKTDEEFITLNGFQAPTGRPIFYMVDKNGGKFVFNTTADKDYTFIPIYFRLPSRIQNGLDGDTEKLWLDSDHLAVQGLIHQIYIFTGDDRELAQERVVEKILAKVLRSSMQLGGGSARLGLSPERFRSIKF